MNTSSVTATATTATTMVMTSAAADLKVDATTLGPMGPGNDADDIKLFPAPIPTLQLNTVEDVINYVWRRLLPTHPRHQ